MHQTFTGSIPGIKSSKGIQVPTTKKSLPKLTVCRTINIVYIIKYRLCRDSGMEGHTQKYHMSDNVDWPKPRKAGTHLIYIR